MDNIFIDQINIKNVRNIPSRDIMLDPIRKHLIVTGKNGSGKSTLLSELHKFLSKIASGEYHNYDQNVRSLDINRNIVVSNAFNTEYSVQTRQSEEQIKYLENWFESFGGAFIHFNNKDKYLIEREFVDGNFILAYFDAKRSTQLKTPVGINRIEFEKSYYPAANAKNEFIQYIVNLKADRSFAKDDNDIYTVEKIDEWFLQFEEGFKELLGIPDMQLKFNREEYNFNIIEPNKQPYNLNQLSDGFSAILSMVTELMMRMEKQHEKNYDLNGIVLIDEVELHLHVDLQKKILPFLTSFFPCIQFIVSTHSPFVLSSLENTTIWDLEKDIITTDLSGYSYDTLIESYFNSDKYSKLLTEKLQRFEFLKSQKELTDTLREELAELKKYLSDIPKFLSDELAVKIQQILLKDIKIIDDSAK